MKVLMIVRANFYTSPGGDTTQVLMTASYLRKLGVEVDVFGADRIVKTADYDLLHFFNIIRPDDIIPYINNQVPFVVSTIFVDFSEYDRLHRRGLTGNLFKMLSVGQIEYAKALARLLVNGDKIRSNRYLLTGHLSSMKFIAKRACMLLPNSHSEAKRLFDYLGFEVRYHKVVNAIDETIFSDYVTANESFRDHVICVGRIEGRKNQLNLIKAVLNTNLQLTIIGKPSPNHIQYYNSCVELASTAENIRFINHIEHEDLVGIYKAAKVHVLASWFETTGLSSLEAGVMDCNIVITDKGDTAEYFGDMAYYCNPEDVASIRQAVMRAYEDPLDLKLKRFILDNYTWSDTASQTLHAYNEVLKLKN